MLILLLATFKPASEILNHPPPVILSEWLVRSHNDDCQHTITDIRQGVCDFLHVGHDGPLHRLKLADGPLSASFVLLHLMARINNIVRPTGERMSPDGLDRRSCSDIDDGIA